MGLTCNLRRMSSQPTPSTFYVSLLAFVVISVPIELITDPPSQPFIHGYTKGQSIPIGTLQKISCTSTGGNPLATITWYKNDKKVHANSFIWKIRKMNGGTCVQITSNELIVIFNCTPHHSLNLSTSILYVIVLVVILLILLHEIFMERHL